MDTEKIIIGPVDVPPPPEWLRQAMIRYHQTGDIDRSVLEKLLGPQDVCIVMRPGERAEVRNLS